MRLGTYLTDKPIFSMKDGRKLGTVKDLYLDRDLQLVTGLDLGSEGLFSRKSSLIRRNDIVVLGIDAVLVRSGDVIYEKEDVPEAEQWLRRKDLQGREVDTPGGTKIGQIGDVIVDVAAEIAGFSLSRVYVEGPVADSKAITRNVVIDSGRDDNIMTIDLAQAEQQEKLSIDNTLFSRPVVTEPRPEEQEVPDIAIEESVDVEEKVITDEEEDAG